MSINFRLVICADNGLMYGRSNRGISKFGKGCGTTSFNTHVAQLMRVYDAAGGSGDSVGEEMSAVTIKGTELLFRQQAVAGRCAAAGE